MSCEICKTINNLQVHHDSHNPPKTRVLCISCHKELHHHGTGNKTAKNPLDRKRKYDDKWKPYKRGVKKLVEVE